MKPIRVKSDHILSEYRNKPCVICGDASQPCHIKSKGSGGGDTHDNLIAMCFKHHRAQHDRGWVYMAREYPALEKALKEKGWFIVMELGKIKLSRLNQGGQVTLGKPTFTMHLGPEFLVTKKQQKELEEFLEKLPREECPDKKS